MTLKSFFNAPRLESSYLTTPASIAENVAFCLERKNPDRAFELMNNARVDSRSIKYGTAVLAAMCIYSAGNNEDPSHKWGLLAAGAVMTCIANDHRRYQKQHTEALKSPEMHEIACKRANWHLMD